METTPFFVFLFIHLSSLILGFGSVLVTDLYGLLWLVGRVPFTQVVRVSGVTERFIWVGWAGMVAAGIPLLVLKGVVDNLLIVKLFFVALIGLNGIPLHLLQKKMKQFTEGEDVPPLYMYRLMLALLVSQLGWWGAVVIGFLHRHVQTVIEWPEAPWLLAALIFAGILAVWAGGEAVVKATTKA